MPGGNFNKGKDHPGFRHGMHSTREYKSWQAMKSRCRNKNDPSYHRYGAVGIDYIDEWKDFPSFYADMGPRPKGKTLDRIDNSKGYSKDNCRWANSTEQTRNRSDTNLITAFGKTQCFKDWCEEFNIARSTVYNRMKRNNMDFEKAIIGVKNEPRHSQT